MHKLRSAFVPWGVAALGALALTGCERISSHRVEAVATDAKNARRNGSQVLLAGDNVAAGARIVTAGGGHADVMLLPNMLVRLEENGAMHITDLKFSADGNETTGGVRERAAMVTLSRGQLTARLEQHGYSTASLVFQTSRGEMRADGNALFQITEQPGATSATCIRGHLDITPASLHRLKTLWPGETMLMDDAGSRRVALDKTSDTVVRCAQLETTLQFEANAQMEARR